MRPLLAYILCIFCGILFSSNVLVAQSSGEWEIYSALDRSTSIAADGEGRLWVGTTGGAYRYDPVSREVMPVRTVDALLSLNVSAVGVNPLNGDVYFGSNDGSVSILRSGGWWTYVTDIAQSSRPDRTITGFAFSGEDTYFLTTFGISEFNSTDSTIRGSWTRLGTITPNTRVNDLFFFNDSVWAATSAGVAVAPASGLNLSDPQSWSVYDPTGVCDERALSFAVIDGVLTVGTGDGACEIRDGVFSKRSDLSGPVRFGMFGEHVVAASDFRLYQRGSNGQFSELGGTQNTTVDVASTKDGMPIGAMDLAGLAIPEGEDVVSFAPNGPVSNTFADLAFDRNGDVWVGTGSSGSGVSRLVDDKWLNYIADATQGLNANSTWHIASDAMGRIWVGTFGGGVSLFTLGEGTDVTIQQFDERNSPIAGVTTSNEIPVIAGIQDDGFGKVWMVNWGNVSRLGVPFLIAATHDPATGTETLEGFPVSFAFQGNIRQYGHIDIDFNGTKWLASEASRGLLYFNERSEEIGAEKWGQVTTSNGLLSNIQTALLVDPDGELWIGTPEGLTVLVNPGSVQQNGPGAAIFRTIRSLESVVIRAIAVDALNRKWIGTDNGVVVLSSDGTEVLATYSRENSPLVNDNVLSILPDDITGDIYIGTVNGLAKIATEAVSPQGTDRLHVTPQPFEVPGPDRLRITGLPLNSTVKILTLSGTLVREYLSPGGNIAFWDGLDSNGDPVPSGVYIVGAESSLGETVIGKIAVVRK